MKKIVPHLLLLMILISSSACAGDNRREETPVVGVIILLPDFEPLLDGLYAGLASYGYIRDENITILYDGPLGTLEAVEPAAQNYVELGVDAIVTVNTPPTQIIKAVTADTGIPVLFGATDPVGADLVDSLARPGGNLTGVATGFAEEVRLEWFLRIVPDMETIYAPHNPEDRSAVLTLAMIQEAAERLDITILSPEVRSIAEVSAAIEQIPDQVDGVFLLPDGLVTTPREEWNAAVLANRLPMTSAVSPPTMRGELLSYGFTIYDAGQQVGRMLVQVLEGRSPADLPIEPVEFFLGVNLRTAEAIGMTVPEEILRVADIVIRE